MDPDSPTRNPPGESRSSRGSRRRDQGDITSSSSSSRQHDLVGRHIFIGGKAQQQQSQQQQFQSYPQYQQHYSADPYSDAGSHRSHHRTSNRIHSHQNGSQGSYQAAYHHGSLHKRLPQGQAARHQPQGDGSTWGTCDSFTYKPQLSANAYRQQRNRHGYNDVQSEEGVYDYYDVIVPNSPYRYTSSLGNRVSRSSSSPHLIEPAKKMPTVITGQNHDDDDITVNTRSSILSLPHFLASMFSSSLRRISGNIATAAHLRHASPPAAPVSSNSLLHLRGGGSSDDVSAISVRTSATAAAETKYVTLDSPAPGSPFHYAFPVHSLEEAKKFYGNVLGCKEGRSSQKWQDYSLNGHQIVCHWVGDNYRCVDYYNPVDGDEVPVPHAGLALTVEQFHELAERVRKAGVKFIIEPHLRFKDAPGEQWTMFFKDPSGNNLEFKAMTRMENLFAKYNVVD